MYIFPNIAGIIIKVTKDGQIAGIRAIRLKNSPSDFFCDLLLGRRFELCALFFLQLQVKAKAALFTQVTNIFVT
jgi:hypothetical protein